MADYNPTPWDYEQQQVDEPAVATAPAPTPSLGMVTIGQEDWRTGGPGPVPIPEGQGIRLTGGLPFKPEGPLPWWTIAYEQEKKRMADEARIQEMLRTVPVMQREKALERAKQLEGNLAFQADIQSGMSPQQALFKNAPNLFYNSQNALASVLRYGSRPAQTPFQFGQSIPVEGGTLVRTGPGSSVLVRKKEAPVERPPTLTGRISALKDYMQLLEEQKFGLRSDDPKRLEIQKKQDEVQKDYDALVKRAATGTTAPAAPVASPNKEESRQRAKEYISKYPSKADAIRKRFRETFNEDV